MPVAEKTAASGVAGRPDPLSLVTDDKIDAFERDGAIWLRGLLSPAWLMLIEHGLKRNRNSPGPNGRMHYAGQPGEFWDDWCNYAAIPEYQRLLADSPIVDVVAKVLQTDNLWLFYDQIFVKDGGFSRRTPWHQDTPYWVADGDKMASMWISLDPLTEEETLEVVAGSHKLPLFNGTAFDANDETKPVFDEEEFPRLPDIQRDRSKWPIISWASQPGDVLILHPTTLHGGAEMREGGRRRTLSMRFFGDGVRYAERRGAVPAPTFPGISEALSHGDLLRHPWFPKLFPKPPTPMIGRD